jgi:hypothetical protein
MLLRLETIKFNHDPFSATIDAFNIRRNETEFVNAPEWQRDLSIHPEDSPAAYALCETRANTLTIQASFSCYDRSLEALEIRALDARLYPEPADDSYLLALAMRLLRPALRSSIGNVLGEVEAKHIKLCGGEIGLQTFALKNVRIWDVGVSVQDIVWRWQYRLDTTGEWTDFARTTHRIYTVLSMPKRPWQQEPHKSSNTQLPWAEVLDRACGWAAGAHNADQAAKLITQRVNALGPELFCYEGSRHYTDDHNFDCAAFLSRLHGGLGNGRDINCDDCAAIVSTFANALGCDLSQSSIDPVTIGQFKLKPIIKIGSSDWESGGEFQHHSTASKGGCREEDEVFDACLHVDVNDDPTKPPVALLPSNLRFGRLGEHYYRFRLALPEHEKECVTRPERCQRRRLGPARRLPAPHEERLVILKKEYAFDSWASAAAAGMRLFVSGFFFADYMMPDLRPVRLLQGGDETGPLAIQSFWAGVSDDEVPFLRIDVYERASFREAREGVMALLTTLQEPSLTLQETPELGDVVFANTDFSSILFAIGNLVFFLRNVGQVDMPLTDVAAAINKSILTPPPDAFVELGSPSTVRQFKFERVAVSASDSVRIKEEPADPLARRRLYQFFTETGEVSLRGRQLVYQPESAGPKTLDIFAVDASGHAVKQVLQLEAE